MTDFYWELDPKIRTKHLYIPGMSGYGKTSLMANLAIDAIESADGPVIIIDPKGSREGLVERVIKHIPRRLVPNTVYISLRHPVPVDLMQYDGQQEKGYVRNDIIAILKRFSFGSWGPTMQGTLNNLIPTLLEAKDTTFLDVGRFLESKKRREEILEQVSQERRDYWTENPPSKSDVAPISTRMSNFYEDPLKTIVSTKRGEGVSIAEIIEKNQILLVDTSPLSEDGLMLGALVMSRIQQAIFRRSPDTEHPTCHVYADEFHNFQTSAFNVMLSQARSFNLSLCLANQQPKQITDIWDDVIGNVSSYVIFRMAGEHANMLKSKIQEPPINYPDASKHTLEESLDIWYKREASWAQAVRSAETVEDRARALRSQNDANDQIKKISDRLYDRHKPFLDQIPSLPVGEVIYVDHTGKTDRIKLRTPPVPPPLHYAKEIMSATVAQSSTNRSTQTPPRQNEGKMLSSKNNEHYNPKPDVPPQGAPDVPPHTD